MTLPAFNMRQLLEAGVHFGHQSHRWNPKMAPFIYGARNNIHIIDLTQTTPMLHQALVKISDTVASGGRVLFVATKRQASDSIADSAKRSAQYFINHRWLGGTLTNWKTISQSIRRLRQLDDILADPQGRTKKEMLNVTREREKLDKALGGIKDMGGTPDLLFVIDTNKESIAIKEAQEARHSDRGDRRHQLRSRRHRLPDPRQRRRRPRDHALLRPHRARRARRSGAQPDGGRRRCRRLRGAARRGSAAAASPATSAASRPRAAKPTT